MSHGPTKHEEKKPSFTFLSKKRAPYSYVKPHEAPDCAKYRPKYEAVDRTKAMTHIDARLGDSVDIRQSFKPKPACVVVGRNQCSLQARIHVREITGKSA